MKRLVFDTFELVTASAMLFGAHPAYTSVEVAVSALVEALDTMRSSDETRFEGPGFLITAHDQEDGIRVASIFVTANPCEDRREYVELRGTTLLVPVPIDLLKQLVKASCDCPRCKGGSTTGEGGGNGGPSTTFH